MVKPLTVFIMSAVCGISVFAYAADIYDPTTPLISIDSSSGDGSNQKNSNLVLQSVMHGNGSARAVISGEKCIVGKMCHGYILIALGRKTAVLRVLNSKETITLRLYSSDMGRE